MNHGPHGRPGIVIDPGGRVSLYDYDASGNVLRASSGYRLTSASGDGISYSGVDPITQEFQYDRTGNLTGIRYADGSAVQYEYDRQGALASVVATPASARRR